MKKNRGLFIMGAILVMLTLITMSLTSCEPEEKDKKSEDVAMNPNGSINVEFKISHYDSYDILSTMKTVHNENGGVYRVIYNYDTIPKMSTISETLETGRTYEDDNGDEQSIDTTIVHPKDYQLYISVKK